jgi:hypothetical protein
MQPTQLFQRHPAAALEYKTSQLHRSSEEHRVAPRHAQREGIAETTSVTGFIRVKQVKRRNMVSNRCSRMRLGKSVASLAPRRFVWNATSTALGPTVG